MEKTHKIIIIALIAIIIALGAGIALSLMHEQTKTVELIKNGTTVEVPESAKLENTSELGNSYVTGKNTSVMGIDNNGLAGALASGILSKLIVEHGEMQDNGLYRLDKKSIMELCDQLGKDYDEKNLHEVSVAIKNNNTVNQTVIILGTDENEITDIMNSIHWKMGETSAVANATSTGQSTSTSAAEKTYPFYADDGTIVGYYHVGDVVEHYDGLYQLKSNGEWVYIGEAKGSSQSAYNQGYSDGVEDSSSSDYYDSSDYDYDYEDYDYEDYNEETSEY